MKDKFYGTLNQNNIQDKIEKYVEEVKICGFSIIEDVLSENDILNYRNKIDSIYKIQEDSFGLEKMSLINELNVCRMPLKYDLSFLDLATNSQVLKVVQSLLGDKYILGLQNAIINKPHEHHHQSSWHRDLPHQNFVISTPLSINAMFCIDDFNEQTGGTVVVPYTHKMDILPSDSFIQKHSVTVNAKSGSVVIFDSMILHKAGFNSSSIIRRGVNHQYQLPFLKQFYDFPKIFKHSNIDSSHLNLLGFSSENFIDDIEYRNRRLKLFSM